VAKTKEMKGSFNEQFASVHELCLMVLTASARPDLIKATLMTLNSFLGWVPLGYILESNMVDILLGLMTKEGYRYVHRKIEQPRSVTRTSSHIILLMLE